MTVSSNEPADPSAQDIKGLYERHAQAWDRARGEGSFVERPWIDAFRNAAVPGLPILDLGCGSGHPIARYLLETGNVLSGVDASPTLIGLCRQRFPNGTWIVADMRRLQLGQGFGGICAWDSFFHLAPDDQRAMFPIFRAHALSGTTLMFTSGPSHGEAIGRLEGEPLYHASLSTAEYRALLDRYGFDVLRHSVEDKSCGDHTIWLAKSR